MLLQVRRWLPKQALVIVANSSFAALELLRAVRQMPHPLCLITRLRLDAAPGIPGAAAVSRQTGFS